MTVDKYGYGIRIKLGQVKGNCNLNQELSEKFNLNNNWKDLNGNYKNFAWKYPHSEQYNFVDFKKDEVRQLAANDTGVIDLIYDDFIITIQEVKKTLNL